MPLPASADVLPANEDPFLGTPYRAVQRLAAGGMGEVFVIAHRELGREFVAKVLHGRLATDTRLLDRMRIEAQALGRLDHPHIVSVSGFGTARDGRPFIVMERLRGQTLTAELAARGRLPVVEALTYARQLLSALSAAHAIGIVHRDIKPDNLFLVALPDGTRLLKVLDFGVARVLPGFGDHSPEPLAVPTDTGIVVGTPRFVSPEGATGAKVDQRADLYTAGLVLYAMLAGRGPFDHLRGEAELLMAHASTAPLPPSTAAGAPLPPSLDGAVLHALAKRPDDRFQTAQEFIEALDYVAGLLSPTEMGLKAHVPPVQALQASAVLSVAASDGRAGSPSSSGLRRVSAPGPSNGRLALLFIVIAAPLAIVVSQIVRVLLAWRSP